MAAGSKPKLTTHNKTGPVKATMVKKKKNNKGRKKKGAKKKNAANFTLIAVQKGVEKSRTKRGASGRTTDKKRAPKRVASSNGHSTDGQTDMRTYG